MIKDRTGRKIKVGQLIHFHCSSMVMGKVIEIHENTIMLSKDQGVRPHIVIQSPFNTAIGPDETVDCYIVQEPDPKDPLVLSHEDNNLRLIKPS